MERDNQSLEEYFNGWYAAMATSPVKDEIKQRHLGLPPHLLSTSLLGWQGIAEVTHALRLSPGDVLLDLACGRGGYGLEVTQRTRARLVGVDFAGEAVRQAAEQARLLGRSADFRVADLTATGLADSSVNAVLCVDAIQFANSHEEVYREVLRLLVTGGRAVLTWWEPRAAEFVEGSRGSGPGQRRCSSVVSRRRSRCPGALRLPAARDRHRHCSLGPPSQLICVWRGGYGSARVTALPGRGRSALPAGLQPVERSTVRADAREKPVVQRHEEPSVGCGILRQLSGNILENSDTPRCRAGAPFCV